MKKVFVKQLRTSGLPLHETLTTNQVELLTRFINKTEDASLLSASIFVNKAYEDSVAYLETKSGLGINVTDYEYFRINDASVDTICANTWGDTIGISRSQASNVFTTSSTSVPAFSTQFTANPYIKSFPEFYNFTEVAYIPGTSQATGAFADCTALTTITLPTKVITINQYAFCNDASLASVYNASNVRTVQGNAFQNCRSLTILENIVPNLIGNYAFNNCTSLKNINLSSIEYLTASHVFEGCTSLDSSFNMGGLMTIIGPYCFKDCTSIENLINTLTVNRIDDYAFTNDIKLKNVGEMKPNSVGAHSFENCTSLVSFTFNDSSCVIGDHAFSNDASLSHIPVIKSKATIGEYAFSNCQSLDYIHLRYNGLNELSNANAFVDTSTTIYFGNASYPYHDNTIMRFHKNNAVWGTLSDRFDTWFNHENVLPSEYERTDYIQSDGINRINTGITFADNTRFIADMSFIFHTSGAYAVYGSEESGLRGNSSVGVQALFSNKTQTLVNKNTWLDRTERLYEIDTKNNIMKVNETQVYEGTDGESLGGTISLFGTPNSAFIGRAWYTSISNDTQTLSNLIPCYRKSDNKVGFYDTISETFSGYSTYTCKEVQRRFADYNGDILTTEDGFEIII